METIWPIDRSSVPSTTGLDFLAPGFVQSLQVEVVDDRLPHSAPDVELKPIANEYEGPTLAIADSIKTRRRGTIKSYAEVDEVCSDVSSPKLTDILRSSSRMTEVSNPPKDTL
jgi:hypothetical protein